MGRDFSYQINDYPKQDLCSARNTVPWMNKRKFTYSELKEYIRICLDKDEIIPIEALAHVLSEMSKGDTATISSC